MEWIRWEGRFGYSLARKRSGLICCIMTSEGVNNGMKRRNILSLFFLILLFVSIIPTTAFAIENIDPYQKLFNEDLGKGFKDGKPLFMRYSLINYRLDYTSGD